MKPRTRDPDLLLAARRARRRFSVGYMSDYKWRKLFSVLESDRMLGRFDPGLDRMTVKLVGNDEPSDVGYPPDRGRSNAYMEMTGLGQVALRAIEWIEFRGDLTPRLALIGRFTTEMHGGCTRVMGYGSPVQMPN